MPTVSVIIPTWNRANELKRSVLSVLKQTYPVSEILVCDDGSTDNSKELITTIGSEKVRWLKGTHSGLPSVPRNRGIAASTGEWLAFLDNDDEWLPEKIEKQIIAAEMLKTNAVCCNAFHITSTGISNRLFLDYSKEHITFCDLLKSNYVICSTSMIKRSMVPVVLGFPETQELKALEDYALWLRVATLADFAFVNLPLANYYDMASQSIRSNDTDTWNQRIRVFSNFKSWLRNSMEQKKYYPLAEKAFREAMRKSGRSLFLYSIKKFFS